MFDFFQLSFGYRGNEAERQSRHKGGLPLVSIVDDPWLEGGLATVSFDGEGVPTKYKELVSDGVLQGFVYGLALADKHKTVTTGNGGGGCIRCFLTFI